jgi:hypothetical protein
MLILLIIQSKKVIQKFYFYSGRLFFDNNKAKKCLASNTIIYVHFLDDRDG